MNSVRNSVNRNNQGFSSDGPKSRKFNLGGSQKDNGEEEKIEPTDNRSNVAPQQ